MRVAVALALVAAIATPVRAAGGDAEERARAHYEIALGLYRLGDYHGALKEFAAGYELARKPGFLLNLGQTYRKLGELRSARDMYRQFLAESRATDPARPEAQRILAEIEEAIRAQPEPPPEPPPPPPPPEPPATTSAPATPAEAAPAPPVQPVEVHAAPLRRHHPRLRIAGIALGAVGVGLLGAGIGTAVAADHVARDLNALDAAGAPFDAGKDRAYSLDHALSIAFFTTGAVVAAGGIALVVVGAR